MSTSFLSIATAYAQGAGAPQPPTGILGSSSVRSG